MRSIGSIIVGGRFKEISIELGQCYTPQLNSEKTFGVPLNPNLITRKFILAIGIIALLLAMLMGWATISNGVASRKASTFNSSISVGEPIEAVISRAQKLTPMYIYDSDKHEAFFIFHGFVFSNASCTVKVENGRVISSTYRKAFD